MNGYDPEHRPWLPEQSVLIADVSGTMGETDYAPTRLDGAKEAASVFLRRKPLVDHRDVTAVVIFNDDARQVAEFGLHPVEAERLLAPVAPSGKTNITAALELALRLVTGPWFKIGPMRRCVLLSDGHHNVGPDPVEAGIVARLRRDGVIVDCVAIGDANEALLRSIAKDTDGVFTRCGNVEELRALYDRLAEKKPMSLG